MSENVNCFVFRTANVPFVKQELNEGRLRQGWSPPGTSLLDADGKERNKEEWKRAYKDAWGHDPSPKRYGILRRMLDMKKGDLVVCPKMPDDSCFTIAIASGPYRFEVAPGQEDLGHIIPVEHQREVKNWLNSDSRTISELFKSTYFRAPVTKVQDSNRDRILDAAQQVRKEEDTSTAQDPVAINEEFFAKARKEAAKHLIEHFRQRGFDQFEAAVGQAFVRKGYKYIEGNSYQSGGADADHVLSIPIPVFEGLDIVKCRLPLLIVQVKRHTGDVAPDDWRGVNQLSRWKSSEGDLVVARVLFSSADRFTEECKRLAEENDVMLICGEEAGLFML